MDHHLPRRSFLKLSLAAAAAPVGAHFVASTAAAQPKPVRGADKLTAYQVEAGNPHIWVRWANRLLTSYRAICARKQRSLSSPRTRRPCCGDAVVAICVKQMVWHDGCGCRSQKSRTWRVSYAGEACGW